MVPRHDRRFAKSPSARKAAVDPRTHSFADRLQATIASGNRRGQSLLLGRTPAVLRMLAVPDLPLRMTPGVLQKILTGKDGQRDAISSWQLEKLPELLDEPAAVLESATVASAIVVLTTARNASGMLIASINKACRDGNSTVNLITSVYAKERENWILEQVAAQRVLYADTRKGLDTLEASSRALNRMTEPGSQSPTARKILLPEDLRKFREVSRSRTFSPAHDLRSATRDTADESA